MNSPKVIQTREQYVDYLAELEHLVLRGPTVNSDESDRLQLLTVLLEHYENTKYPVEAPDPIDAILFRMHEKGLRQTDLIPFLGSSSRVSEVLNRKRPLTVQMIREISNGLGISAETLIGLPKGNRRSAEVDWSRFPIREMAQRGWLPVRPREKKSVVEGLVRDYIAEAGMAVGTAAFKRHIGGEAQSPTTQFALYAWVARVIQTARTRKKRLGPFHAERLDADFLRELARLSWSDRGPLLAVELLEKCGIAVVIEPHLKGTRLDGAALMDADGTRIVGLTLRYDRLDNFWFVLLHEVAHLWRHVTAEDLFLDDLDADSEDQRESEANRLARESCIPRLLWKRSTAFISPSHETIDELSRQLRVHPAIIAGRLRRDTGNYQIFSEMLGHNTVRPMFEAHALRGQEG